MPTASAFPRLVALMRLSRTSHATAAARVGIQRPLLTLILNGKRRPSPLVAERLADLERALAAQAAPVLAELSQEVRHGA